MARRGWRSLLVVLADTLSLYLYLLDQPTGFSLSVFATSLFLRQRALVPPTTASLADAAKCPVRAYGTWFALVSPTFSFRAEDAGRQNHPTARYSLSPLCLPVVLLFVLVDRGAGGAHKAARVRNTEDSSSAVATSGPRGSDPAAVSSPLQPATPKSSSHPKRGEIRTSAALDEDEDDTGEHIGRAPMATEEEAGEEVEMEEQAVAAAAEKKTQQKQSTKKLGRAAAESTKGGGGRGRASAAVETSVDARADGAQRASGESGASSNEGARKTRVGAARKKVRVLIGAVFFW